MTQLQGKFDIKTSYCAHDYKKKIISGHLNVTLFLKKNWFYNIFKKMNDKY